MPIYQYYCSKCSEEFEAFDLMSEERTECLLCGHHGGVVKVPLMSEKVKLNLNRKVGDLVKEYIKDSKEDLQRQVEDLKKGR